MKRVFLLKPFRATDEQPVLNAAHIKYKRANGYETVLILDLNILNSFKDYLDILKFPAKETIDEIVQIKDILQMPGIVLAPGLALAEADSTYLFRLIEAYENFMRQELPDFTNAHNANQLNPDRVKSKKYLKLPTDEKIFLSLTHLAMLKIHDILIFHKTDSPESKFDRYLEYMDGVANVVSSFEAEVAKYCFCDRSDITNAEFAQQCKIIRANFDKRGNGESRLDRILNGTRDLMYVRGAAIQEDKVLDGYKQDIWLMTRDTGLVKLLSSIYYFPVNGKPAHHTALARNRAREENMYWRYVDKATAAILDSRASKRSKESSFGNEDHLRRLAAKAGELTQKIIESSSSQ